MSRRYTKTDLATLKANGLGAVLGPPARKRSNEESIMQRRLISWWRDQCGAFGMPEILLFSIPNGANGDAKRGSIMKQEGQRKGAPDLVLSVARYDQKYDTHYHGLFLELKRKDGYVNPDQVDFHDALRSRGYQVNVIRSLNEGIDVITTYLNS